MCHLLTKSCYCAQAEKWKTIQWLAGLHKPIILLYLSYLTNLSGYTVFQCIFPWLPFVFLLFLVNILREMINIKSLISHYGERLEICLSISGLSALWASQVVMKPEFWALRQKKIKQFLIPFSLSSRKRKRF